PEVREPERAAAQGRGAGVDGGDAGGGRRGAGDSGAAGGLSAAARPRQVAVIGAGGAAPDSEAWELAEAVGRGLAAAGVVLVCGGRGGVMEAACRGAAAAGGE